MKIEKHVDLMMVVIITSKSEIITASSCGPLSVISVAKKIEVLFL